MALSCSLACRPAREDKLAARERAGGTTMLIDVHMHAAST
jgi:hypothetical protein